MPWHSNQESTPTESALRERVKELACLYEIARLLGNPEETLDQQLQRIASLLPDAWQYPQICGAKITLDACHFESHFENIQHVQKAGIVIQGEERGQIEVGYNHPDLPEAAEGPFLLEERNLIENIARQIAVHVNRHEVELHHRDLEEQLRHADRLATIGQLASGVAHEMNEPLGNILGFAQLALKTPDLVEQLESDLQQIVDAALRGRETVKKLLLFARQTPPRKTLCNLNRVIDEAVFLLEAGGEKQGIQFSQTLCPDLPYVEGDPMQLRQVVVNLVVNAMQSIEGKGQIDLETRVVDGDVELSISDTGCGMSAEVLKRIFDPFFTTKEIGKGTGLGLSVVHGIINAHNGEIFATSTPGKGSCFVVRIPGTDSIPDGEKDVS